MLIDEKTKNKFLDKYDYWFLTNCKSILKDEKSNITLLNIFLEKYPKKSIMSMEIDDYVEGKKLSSFCWWVDTKLWRLGDIRGRPVAFQKYGIYYAKDIKDYVFGSKKTKHTKFGSSNYEIFENIKKEIFDLICATKAKDYKSIVNNKLNDLFKNKLTYLYDCENWLPIYSENDLNTILQILNIRFDLSSDRVYKRIKLYDFYKSLGRDDITPLLFMSFIYNDLGYKKYLRTNEAHKLNEKIKIQNYSLVEVTKIEEIILSHDSTNHGLVHGKHEFLEQKKLTGKKGEEIVKEYLFKHKNELDIVGNIDCACEYDDSKHYDYSYKNSKNEIIYIEVKATKNDRKNEIYFEMSDNEYAFMEKNISHYFIFFINNVFNGNVIKKIPANLVIAKPDHYKIFLNDLS